MNAKRPAPPDLRALLEAISEALDVPFPARMEDDRAYWRALEDRVIATRTWVRSVRHLLSGDPDLGLDIRAEDLAAVLESQVTGLRAAVANLPLDTYQHATPLDDDGPISATGDASSAPANTSTTTAASSASTHHAPRRSRT